MPTSSAKAQRSPRSTSHRSRSQSSVVRVKCKRKLSAVKAMSQSGMFRLLPSLDELLRHPAIEALVQREGRSATVAAARAVLEQLRTDITAGKLDEAQIRSRLDDLPPTVEQRLRQSLAYSLRPVINATGVILHKNLGRAPLSRAALEHVAEVSQGYSNLEFNLGSGERGQRDGSAGGPLAAQLDTR